MPLSIPHQIVLPCLVALFIIAPFRFDLIFDVSGDNEGEVSPSSNSVPTASSDANLSDSAFSRDQYATLLDDLYTSYSCVPKGVHIAQKNNVHEIPWNESAPNFHNYTTEFVVDMTLSFLLDYGKCQNATAKLWYRQGFHPEVAVEVPLESALQFNFTSETPGIDFFQSDYIYHVTLPRIRAGGHRYRYRMEVHDKNSVGHRREEEEEEATVSETGRQLLRGSSSSLLGKTPVYSFITPPLPNTPTSVALVGDLGQTKNSTKTMEHILHDSLVDSNKNPTTLLLIAGDMSYADSEPLRWKSWFDLMEPLTRSLPMHTAAGNHEIECDNATLEVFKQYEHYFHNPNRIAKADMRPITEEYRETLWYKSCSTPSEFRGHYNYGNAFYSFQHGYIHFIVLSSYSDSRRGSPQYEWLYEELQFNVNRTLTPWLIVSFHSPLYTTFNGHVNESQSVTMKESMEPLFNEYGVNLIVSGHDHGYMRTHPLLANGTIDESGKAPIYLSLGAGGNREQHSRGYRNETHQEEWVAKRDLKDFGYGNLFVMNATHATLTWVRDKIPGSDDGSDDKNVWIVNKHVPGPGSTNNNLHEGGNHGYLAVTDGRHHDNPKLSKGDTAQIKG